MEKIKKSLFSKISAIVLALALVMGTIPTSIIRAQAANDENGTVEVINEVGGVIDETDATNIVIKYEGEGVLIKHLESDDTTGRTNSGWYVGAIMNAPQEMTDFSNSVYKNAEGTEISFGDVASVEPIYMWKQIDKTVFETAKAEGTDLEYTWEFDWDTTTEGTQKVAFRIDTETVALSDEDTVKPVVETIAANPSEWTNGAVVISGTVSDNFSGVKSVSYKQEGSEEVKEAALTGSSSFSFTVDATVYEGKYIVWCTDNKGNVSDEMKISVYMDNVAPTVTAKVSDENWTDGSLIINGTVKDADSGVKEIYYQKAGETKVKLEDFDVVNGTYSVTIPAQEYAGNYTIYCVDNANNESTAVVAVKMDNKVPEVTDVKADVEDWTNSSVTISGKVSDTLSGIANVTWMKESDQTTGTATFNADDNTFTFEVLAQSYKGSYIITCTDNAGNTTAGNTVSVKMDNGVCVVATGAADKADWTDESVIISGTVSDDLSGVASVTWVKEDDNTTGTAVFNVTKNEYAFEVNAQDYAGNYIITCTDKAGNVSAEFPVAVKMDITNPVVESVKADITDWTNGSVVITGKASDNLSGIASVMWKRADGNASGNATYNEDNNTFVFTVEAQAYAGAYTITCMDKAGNVSEEKSVSVLMDNVAPTLTAKANITDWTNDAVIIDGEVSDNLSGVVSVSYGKPGEEVIVITLDEGVRTYSITLNADDYDGNYNIFCTDEAGNKSTITEIAVKMDNIAPVVESAKPSTVDWTNGAVVISGQVSDNRSGVASVTWVKANDNTTGTATFEAESGKFSFEVPAQDYEGNYVITCIDAAGTISNEMTVGVKMDKTVPVVTKAEANITTWTNGQVVISGTVEDNLSGVVSVECKKTGTEKEESVIFDATKGKYTIVLPADDYKGTYTIYCTDAASNKSAGVTVAVQMDKTVPTLLNVKADITDWTNGNVVITGNYDDNLSGVQEITVVKKSDGTTQSAIMNAVDKTFRFEIPAQNYKGDYIITCTDAANNESNEATVSVQMDNTQCVVATGVAVSDKWTSEKVVISGTVSDNLSGVKEVTWVKAGDNTTGIAVFDANRDEYTFEVPAQDYAGNYIITCTDKAGNISAKFPVAVQMDITNPVVEKAEANIKKWTSSAIVISGEVSDNLAGVETVTWVKAGDNTTGTAIFNETERTFTIDVPAQDYAGDYVITCMDKAGNVSAEFHVPVQMDITNPVVEKAEASTTEWTKESVVISGEVSDNLAGVETVTWVKVGDNTTGTAIFNETERTFTINVPAQDYKGKYIITCTDKAGNVSAEFHVPVQMDITNPVVEKAEASTTEWTKESVVISGEVSDNLAGVEAVSCIKESDNSNLPVSYDEGNGTFTINIPAQSYKGNYIITCTDRAGNVSAESEVAVKMDNVRPHDFSEPELRCGTSVWKKVVEKVTFGLFYNEEQTMFVNTKDDLSGIKKIECVEKEVVDGEKITEEIVGKLEGWQDFYVFENECITEPSTKSQPLPVDEKINNRNIIYCVRITDYAGNVSYVTSDGLIIDIVNPAGGFDNNKMILPAELPMNGEDVVYVPNDSVDVKRPLYGKAAVGEDGVVIFKVKITEETLKTVLEEATDTSPEVVKEILQSGIKKVSYKVEAKDREGEEYTYAITQGAEHDIEKATVGDLYTWNGIDSLKTEFTGTIEVDATKNNYNYVKVTVTVTDNAGNKISDDYEIAIDIAAPTVAISYNMNTPVDEEGREYFNCQRIATITYTERSENWSSDDAEKELLDDGAIKRQMIQALDINGNSVENSYTIKWDDVLGTKSDEDKHIATVSFNPTNILEKEEEGTEDIDNTEKSTESSEPVTGADARYEIDTAYTDAAGNSAPGNCDEIVAEGTVHPFNFVIDTVSPVIEEIKYEEKVSDAVINTLLFNYFGTNVQVTVKIKDETAGVNEFDYEGLLDADISDKNKAVIKTEMESAEIVQQEEDKSLFVVQFQIPKEALTELNSFRGTVKVNAYDYCNNTVQVHDQTRLVVDKIAPKAQITFDQPVKEADGISYYDNSFTATIVIDEANFYAEDVQVLVNDSRVYPTDWKQEGDIWTSHVSFTEENDYVLKVNYEDRSGNVMTPYESNQKTLDTTDPVIAVSNLKHESANNEETIGFVLTVTDKNIALADIKPQVTAVIRKGDNSSNYTYETIGIALGTPAVSTNAKGETVYTYTVKNLEIDGYYSIVCSATDHANHRVSNIGVSAESGRNSAVETMNFSVNREGSVFWIETEHTDKYTEQTMKDQLDGAYANDQVTVRLHEINVDKVDDSEADDKRTVLTLNDGNESNTIELVEGGSGSANYERNVSVGRGGWYKTTYTLNNEQFKNDGTYSLNIITYDKAENSNVNTKSEEGTIKFVVDRTNPVISSNVKNEQVIKENGYTVEFKVADVNLDTETVVVKLNGEEIKCKEVSTGTYQFTVDEAKWKNFPKLSQDFEIEAKDLAGNSAEIYERNKITVTDNVFIQVAAYMINHPLVLGLSATGLVALVGFFIFLIIFKRRKEKE